jgi:two-component system chemotaxis sensor kinase CheA
MTSIPEVNRDLLLDFVEESMESLGAVESLFVRLEELPDDATLVERIFRPVHSLKGNAAYFGLMRVKEISHRMESLLDQVRQGRRKPDRGLGNLLLRGLDVLRTLLSRARDALPEEASPEEFAGLLADLEHVAQVPSEPTAVPDTRYREAEEFIATLPEPFRSIGLDRLHHAARPESVASGSTGLSRLASLLTDSDQHRLSSERERAALEEMDRLLGSESSEPVRIALREILDIARTFIGSAVGLDALARELILDKIRAILASPTESGKPIEHQPPGPSSAPVGRTEAPRQENRERTMRIPEASMDRFLDQVGELMGLEEQFRYLGKRMLSGGDSDDLAADLRQAVEQFGHLSSRLSGAVLELRRTEARPLLQKVPRLCRDVAARTGKNIEAVVRGEDVRIDKSYLELLDAPLMHMVRNACDHGVEGREERLRLGKPETGRVEVSIAEMEESVVMRVEDDGRGLDLDGLRRKAVELGLQRPDAPFGETEAVQVLFRSGISTAAAVTEISGRGVGMDVVKKEIEGAGGRVEVRNDPGRGCAFLVTLPRGITTRITDGFLFRCGRERFVVPMRVVVETFPASSAKVDHLPRTGATVLFRDEILRMVESSAMLDSPLSPDAEGVFVRLRAREVDCVLRVEEVLGVQRTVVKPVDDICRASGLFAGAALVGDGGLAMVVGEDGLADWLRRGAGIRARSS